MQHNISIKHIPGKYKEGYVCRIPTVDEMKKKWDYEIGLHEDKENWICWKAEAIDHYIKGVSVPYYGILNGTIICEATAILDHDFGVDKSVELNGFRTIKEFRGQGYFSVLMDFILKDLKQKAYIKAVVGVEPCEDLNRKIYHHWGFTEFINSGTGTYPDGTVIEIEYYAKTI